MSLTPEAIFNDFQNDVLDKETAIDLLLSLIENVESIQLRSISMGYLIRIGVINTKVYKSLENICISDSNNDLRIQAAQSIKELYHEKSLPLLKWLLNHEKSLKVLITITRLLGEINSNNARSLLLKKFEEINKKKYKYNVKSLTEENDIEGLSNHELSEVLINYFIISTLKLKLGYLKFEPNKRGSIITLDLSNVDYQGLALNTLSSSLESILSLTFLKKLNLSNNHLRTLPDNINQFNSLEELDLSFNNLSSLPDSISSFEEVKILKLKSNHLRYIPSTIGDLKSLERLILRDNLLKEIPDSIGDLLSLRLLDLHHNHLAKMPENLNNLELLFDLDLGWNDFETVPKSIESMKNISELNLGRNRLIDLPSWLVGKNSIKKLELYDNQLIALPELPPELEILNLRNNGFTELPESLSSLITIKSLNLSWNQLSFIPDWIDCLTALETLNLWGNKLKTIPETLINLKNIKLIYLNFNKIKKIPTFFRLLEEKGCVIKL